MKSVIPLVVVEEHHEAFYVWHYSVQQGWMQPAGNTLLHADSHGDMMLPRLRRPLSSITDLSDLANFTYRELDITNFIWPAVYQGLFNRVLYLRYHHRLSSGGWRTISICGKQHPATEFFIASSLASTPHEGAADTRVVEFAPLTPFERMNTDQPIVLDIDLDYFCCNEYPIPSQGEIETTRAEFEEFNRNPYHLLRLCPSDKASAIVKNGRYYFVLNDYRAPEPSAQSREADIHARMKDFIACLQSQSVQPTLISLCRSAHSGYTPEEWVDYIQRLLISQLAELYRLEKFEIADLLPAGILEKNLDTAVVT